MQFYQFAAVAAFAGLASAQSDCEPLAASIPACALGYIAADAYSKYSCGIVDFACQCSASASILNDGTVQTIGMNPSCNLGDVLNSVNSLCACATASSAEGSITLNSIESQCQATAAAIPGCGLGYIAEAAYTTAGCDLYDFECQCSNFDQVSMAAASDVSTACGSSYSDVLMSASNLCSCVSGAGGSGSGPSSGPTTSGNSGPTTSGSSSSPTGVAPSPSSGKSSAGPKPTATSKTSGSAKGSSTGANKPTATSSVSVPKQSGSGTLSLQSFTGAGATAAGAFGGVVAGIAGIVAYL